MKSTAIQPPLSPRLLCTLQLPHVSNNPGSLHTLLQDDHQNIYYSDEINHSLVSLNTSGEIRWHLTKQGKKPGEFYYPKGIELGCINESGHEIQCVAVCDSWNKRIQFFDRYGAFLTAWDRAGEIGFTDVVDVRFISTGRECVPGHPRWLILDRGQHCIFGFDPSGCMLFRIGKPFPESLEPHWPTPGGITHFQMGPLDGFREHLPYDPLFMPTRIFGSTQDALYVWEQNSRRLKQLAFGNLLPVWINLPSGAEWICAGEDGWVAFNSHTHEISIYDIEGNAWRSASLDGMPIPSGRVVSDIWMQNGSSIQHFHFDPRTERSDTQHLYEFPSALLRFRAEMECQFCQTGLPTIGNCGRIASRLAILAEEVKGLIHAEIPDSNAIKAIRDELAHIPQQTLAEMHELSYFLLQMVLKTFQARSLSFSRESQRYLDHLIEPFRNLIKDINISFVELLSFRDQWILSIPSQILPLDSKIGISEDAHRLVDEIAAVAMKSLDALAGWSWLSPIFEAALTQPDQQKEPWFSEHSISLAGPAFSRPPTNERKPAGFLRELDQIYVGCSEFASPSQPAALAHAQNQHIFVTLQGVHQIMHLSEEGKVLGPISINYSFYRPFGIAVDSTGRVWISEPLRNCVNIVDFANNTISNICDIYGCEYGLQYPFGIQKAANGSMFLADTKNNRVLVFTDEGKVSTFGNGKGTEPGTFLHPASCCFEASEDIVWVVDQRNHRLQKLGLDGVPHRQIGNPGFGAGELILPEFMAIFDDGVIVVNQWACIKALKIFSPDGKEMDTIRLDYSPRGMLIHKNRLLVCSGHGDHIHVYERS